MRSYCAVYVDAGYLLASAATRVTGTSLRGGVTIAYRDLIEALVDQVEKESTLPLLRVNWYDAGGGPGGAPDALQDTIGMLPRLKLRLGRMSPGGEQKGVDLRIGLDLATHGRNRIADVIYLVSGDDDLTEAVEEAQGHGVQVILLAAPDRHGRPHAVSRNLQREADGTALIDPVIIDRFVKPRAPRVASVPIEGAAPEPAPSIADGTAPTGVADGAMTGASAASAAATGARVASASAAGASAAGAAATGGHSNGVQSNSVQPDERPAIPTPAALAGSRPWSTPVHAIRGGEHHAAAPSSGEAGAPRVVYSSVTGHNGGDKPRLTPETEKLVDEVVRGVVDTWKRTVTPDELRTVRSERPYIPRELDRALLLDMSARLGIYDVDEHARLALREHFWEVLGAATE